MYKLLSLILSMSIYGSINLLENKVIVEDKVSVEKVLRLYAKRVNKNLILPKSFKDYEVTVLGKKEFSKEKLKKFLYEVLKKDNLTLLRSNSSLEVIDARDIRYAGMKNIYSIEKVSNTFEYMRFVYKLNYAKANELSRNFRPFVSRYGRVIDIKGANTLIIADTGKNIRKLYEIIKLLDTKDYLNSKAQVEELNDARKEESSFSWGEFFEKKNGLFLILFSLVGLIIGYGARGIIVKREENSWS